MDKESKNEVECKKDKKQVTDQPERYYDSVNKNVLPKNINASVQGNTHPQTERNSKNRKSEQKNVMKSDKRNNNQKERRNSSNGNFVHNKGRNIIKGNPEFQKIMSYGIGRLGNLKGRESSNKNSNCCKVVCGLVKVSGYWPNDHEYILKPYSSSYFYIE